MTAPHVTPPTDPMTTAWESPAYAPAPPQPRRRLHPWMIVALAVTGTLAVILGIVVLGFIGLVNKVAEKQAAGAAPTANSAATSAPTSPSDAANNAPASTTLPALPRTFPGYTRTGGFSISGPEPGAPDRIRVSRSATYRNLQDSTEMEIVVATGPLLPGEPGNPATRIPQGRKGCVKARVTSICLLSSPTRSLMVKVQGPNTLQTANRVFDEIHDLF